MDVIASTQKPEKVIGSDNEAKTYDLNLVMDKIEEVA